MPLLWYLGFFYVTFATVIFTVVMAYFAFLKSRWLWYIVKDKEEIDSFERRVAMKAFGHTFKSDINRLTEKELRDLGVTE